MADPVHCVRQMSRLYVNAFFADLLSGRVVPPVDPLPADVQVIPLEIRRLR